MRDRDERYTRRGGFERVPALALEVDEAVLPHEIESEVANLGLTRGRPEHLVDDAVANRRPQSRAAEGGRHEVLVAARPGRRHPWCTEGLPFRLRRRWTSPRFHGVVIRVFGSFAHRVAPWTEPLDSNLRRTTSALN